MSDYWYLAGVDPKTLVTVVGDLPHAVKGQQLRFVGDWVLHPKHSWQLKATAYEEVVPQSPQAVAAYLASTIEGRGHRFVCLPRHPSVHWTIVAVISGQDKVAQAFQDREGAAEEVTSLCGWRWGPPNTGMPLKSWNTT